MYLRMTPDINVWDYQLMYLRMTPDINVWDYQLMYLRMTPDINVWGTFLPDHEPALGNAGLDCLSSVVTCRITSGCPEQTGGR